MLAILSPAKTMKFDYGHDFSEGKQPEFIREARELVKHLREYSKPQLMKLMSISENLADLNTERFNQFRGDDSATEKAPAIFAFRGDVYQGFDAKSLSPEDVIRTTEHIRILTGLYGILKPLEEIEPYRLEMGTDLKTGDAKNLYEFWGDKITRALKRDMEKTGAKFILNLASNEYANAIDKSVFGDNWIDVDFREMRKGKLRFITFNAKKARGMMARYVVEKGVQERKRLTYFNGMGYLYDEKGSEENKLLFVKAE